MWVCGAMAVTHVSDKWSFNVLISIINIMIMIIITIIFKIMSDCPGKSSPGKENAILQLCTESPRVWFGVRLKVTLL